MIIGVTGCSGSGKTTVAEWGVKEIPHIRKGLTAITFGMDGYYKDQSHLSFEERTRQNYDHPDAFDWPLLREQLEALAGGNLIHMPVYSFKEHTRKPETVLVEPADIIIFEGILTLHEEYIRSLMDLKWFVNTPLGECLRRRIERDINERGRTLCSVVKQWEKQVIPMYKMFVEQIKMLHADCVFEWQGDVYDIKKMLMAQIRFKVLEKGIR